MLQIAVCEDDLLQMGIILSLLDKYQIERPETVINPHPFTSGNDVLRCIDASQKFDLFLLDILMPEMSGIELAKRLRETSSEIPMVFLTSTADYALDAFGVSADQYILKPINHTNLFPVLDKIISSIEDKRDRFFTITIRKNTIKIPHRSIVCAELAGRALRIYLDNGDVLLSSTLRKSFTNEISPLLEDDRFFCEHKSFAINMKHVEQIKNSSFILKGGLSVPIPKYNLARAKAKYLAWLKEQQC